MRTPALPPLVLRLILVLGLGAAPAQHPAMRLATTEPAATRPVDGILGVTDAGVWVIAAAGASPGLIPWDRLDLGATRPEAVAALLAEARQSLRAGQPLPLPLGRAVDAALGRLDPATAAEPAHPAPGGDPSPTPGAAERNVTAEADFETWPGCTYLEHRSNDGDSFHILDAGGREHILRLYFVDCPETNNAYPERVAEQAEALHLDEDETLAVGHYAAAVTRTLLEGEPFTVLTAGQDARGNSRLPRVFGFVVLAGRASTARCEPSLDAELVARGLARRYGARADPPGPSTSASIRANHERLERRAREQHLGAWALAEPETPAPPRRSRPD